MSSAPSPLFCSPLSRRRAAAHRSSEAQDEFCVCGSLPTAHRLSQAAVLRAFRSASVRLPLPVRLPLAGRPLATALAHSAAAAGDRTVARRGISGAAAFFATRHNRYEACRARRLSLPPAASSLKLREVGAGSSVALHRSPAERYALGLRIASDFAQEHAPCVSSWLAPPA